VKLRNLYIDRKGIDIPIMKIDILEEDLITVRVNIRKIRGYDYGVVTLPTRLLKRYNIKSKDDIMLAYFKKLEEEEDEKKEENKC
jgi:hypothetical protein